MADTEIVEPLKRTLTPSTKMVEVFVTVALLFLVTEPLAVVFTDVNDCPLTKADP